MNPKDLPIKFTARAYQKPLTDAILSGRYLRALAIWHRKAGKDKTLLNLVIQMAAGRVGTYYYFFPEFTQARKTIWDGIDNDGLRFLEHFPPGTRFRNDEMKATMPNGSIVQMIGTDSFDRVRGPNPVGCVFSEYAWQDPAAWDVVRPILRSNGGWAVFNTTPFGRNHAYKLFEMAKASPDWFTSFLTIDDTVGEDGNPIISRAAYEAEVSELKAMGRDEAIALQEYYCSFETALEGNYYGKLLGEAEQDGRITRVKYDPSLPVYVSWDLGVGDATALWFCQSVNREFRLIDFYEKSGEGLPHYVKVLQDKPYIYGGHIMPHDAEHREKGTGVSFRLTAKGLGVNPIVVLEQSGVQIGIDNVRRCLPLTWFDKDNCADGLDRLRNYRKKWDDKKKDWLNQPFHDWTSHAADSFRYLMLGIEQAAAANMGEELFDYSRTVDELVY